ncbi:MAG: hypothetical protein CMM01_08825 [Rhodopirellula sp.]|nr:hypothetical protein [Rhodopirellula sp.]
MSSFGGIAKTFYYLFWHTAKSRRKHRTICTFISFAGDRFYQRLAGRFVITCLPQNCDHQGCVNRRTPLSTLDYLATIPPTVSDVTPRPPFACDPKQIQQIQW